MDASQLLPVRDGETAPKLNASVVEYTEITEDNIDSFHFHGDPGTFPLTAAILIPRDEKGRTILLGRYQDVERTGVQLVEPGKVMDELFNTVFQIQRFVLVALILVGIAAVVIALLVFLLSNRLRAAEFSSLRQIGADPATIRLLVGFEGGFVVILSVVLGTVLIVGLKLSAPFLVRLFAG